MFRNIFSARFGLFTALFIAAIAVSNGRAAAQQDSYGSPDEIEKALAQEIMPLANRLVPLMMRISPRKGDQVMPLQILIAPNVPVDPVSVFRMHFHCPWGGSICEPFLRACASLQQSCSCSDYGSIDPDPC